MSVTESSPATIQTDISRRDLEAKFREVRQQVDSATESATTIAIAVGALVAVAAFGVAFWMGKRRGRKATTVVEIKRY